MRDIARFIRGQAETGRTRFRGRADGKFRFFFLFSHRDHRGTCVKTRRTADPAGDTLREMTSRVNAKYKGRGSGDRTVFRLKALENYCSGKAFAFGRDENYIFHRPGRAPCSVVRQPGTDGRETSSKHYRSEKSLSRVRHETLPTD